MNKKRLFPIILYAIPIIFLVISYFFLTTSGEDIYQGANTTPHPIDDAIRIFFVNGRLSDMYGWVVIKFFDYQFNFGIDIIFRLLDLVMSFGIMYLLLYFALGTKPKLTIKDALLFNFIFIMLFLTPHGRVLYAGFSLIHNYTLIGLIPLLFFIPFIRELEGKPVPSKPYFAIIMLLVGVIFGLSSNLVPLATLMTLVVIFLYDKILRRKINWRSVFKLWKIFALIGTIIGICISFFVGPGVSNYANGGYAESYDYVSFADLFANPAANIPRIFHHEVWNFARVLLPLILVAVALTIFYLILKKFRLTTKLQIDQISRRKLELSLGFMICYTLTMSQINFPYRLAFPAYLGGILAVIIYAQAVLASIKPHHCGPWLTLSIPTVLLSCGILFAHAYLLIDYFYQVRPILENIYKSPETSLCVPRDSVYALTAPSAFLSQEDMLTDWVMPVKVYDKTITFCDNI